MPTDQPNTAADAQDLPGTDARDDRTAAAVLSDDQPGAMPGGGGLIGGGTDGASSDSAGGASPNSPLGDAQVGGGDPETEARRRATDPGATPS